MSKSMYCPHCKAYVGDCGHVAGGFTGPSTLSGTCGKCEREYSVTCQGDCLDKKGEEKQGFFISGLSISDDGKTIIDDNGDEVATFREGLTVSSQNKSGILKLPGRLVCKNTCIRWDSDGKCVKYYRECTWEFPPFDF